MWGIRLEGAAALLVLAAAAGLPTPSTAQACFSQPIAPHEGWIGGTVEGGGGEDLRRGVVAGIDIEHLMGIEVRGLWGGYPSVGRAEDLGVRLGVPIAAGGFEVCPYGSISNLDYAFRDTFDVSTGSIAELSLRLGASIARPPSREGSGPRLGALLALEYVYRSWDLDGRRLRLVEDEYVVDVIHGIERTYHLAGRVAGMVRWGRLGVTAGVGTRPRTGSDFVAFVNVGAAAFVRPGRGAR